MNRSYCRRVERRPGLPGVPGVLRGALKFTPTYNLNSYYALLARIAIALLCVWDEPAWPICLPNSLHSYDTLIDSWMLWLPWEWIGLGIHDMIVLACMKIHHMRSQWLGLFSRRASDWPGMWIGHILRSTYGGCGTRRGIPIMGAFGGTLWRTAWGDTCPGIWGPVGVTVICGTL